MRFFKIKLEIPTGSAKTWIPIEALSIGDAFVIADSICLKMPKFCICDSSLTEIDKDEYQALFNSKFYIKPIITKSHNQIKLYKRYWN